MTHSSWHYRKKLKLAICLAFVEITVISSIEPTLAQSIIVPDNTLGSESSRVVIDENSLSQELITGGAQRGVNLFHSFREFNVGEGRAVYFSNPGGIENILGRVTGNSRSEILGKLGVLGNGNLFLINPNGIIFGADASLDVSGSFVATSANAIKFGEQGFFSASSPETPSLLTIKPSALFFNQIGAGLIENSSIAAAGVDAVNNPVFGLRVGDRQSLLLVGGNVLNAGGLNALGGRVELGSVASSGEVGLNVNNQNPALTFPNQVVRGDISLTNGAFVDVAADSGGAIALHAKNIDISRGSSLNAGIAPGLGTPETTAGNITLNATQAISISQSSSVTNQVSEDATGNGGNINIQAGSLNLTEGSELASRILGEGNSGNILVDVSGAVILDGLGSDGLPSRIINSVRPLAIGNGGNINLKAQSLTLKAGVLSSNTFGRGNTGNILVDVSGAVTLDDPSSVGLSSRIVNQVLSPAVGNGGNINIKAESLTVKQGSFLNASISGKGNSGNILIDVKGAVTFEGEGTEFFSGIGNQVLSSGVGNSGDINIKAESLILGQGNDLNASTLGRGNGGNIFVDVKGAVTINAEAGIFSVVRSSGIGNGGDINLKADSLTIRQSGALNTFTLGRGNAGNISVDVKGAVIIDGNNTDFNTGIATIVTDSAIGNGGDINLKAGSLTLTQGGLLSAGTDGRGNAGNIFVDVKGAVNLDGIDSRGFSSGISSQLAPSAIGNGGDINLKADSLTLTQGGFLSTTTFGQGNGGNIGINLMMPNSRLTLSDKATIAANTLGQAKGGNIQIEAFDSINLTNNSEISVNSQGQGDAGDLRITTGFLTLQERSRLLADTFSSEGGNIQLQVRDLLLLRNNSSISSTAGQEETGGNGGNIDINTKFLVAVPSENSDITANAFAGKGGLIKITTQGIFGIEERENLTEFSDITAFSQQNPQLDGEIVIDIQNADISNELVALPTNVVDVSKLIAQRCSVRPIATNQLQSQFIITGRGGLPPQPGEALRMPAIALSGSTINTEKEDQSPDIPSTPLLEANSWRFDEQGQVILTASNASSLGIKHGNCRGNS
ncbi:filamentous hemagglutinin [Nostoc sp. KVJ20]|uniref:two-partner secretion domain-containing protein n=1 Tax=Nostoc sp. KVJ20 TaxID=457944 RepID=UPI00083DF04D|nr:filamentous hemagglutinin N-terminal domain-containing protein [Nostoc sp. KVJ20]ODH02056.1 filamentous hemagglutinin [Nostoc sp. KVJ20]